VQVHLQTNLLVITPEPREALRLEEVAAAVRRAGFVPAQMTLQARGRYVPGIEGQGFLIRGWPQPLRVRARGPLPEGETLLRARVDYSQTPVVLDPFP
jgi:hypothetical protein